MDGVVLGTCDLVGATVECSVAKAVVPLGEDADGWMMVVL